MERHYVEQQSLEWFQLRSQYITASETAGIMGASPWFPKTPRQVFEVKLGFRKVRSNPAMERGRKLEKQALEKFNREYGFRCEPAVFTRERFLASLDGYDSAGVIVEIKCPGDRRKMSDREIPLNYLYQLAVQLYCAPRDVEEVYLVYYFPEVPGAFPEEMNVIPVNKRELEDRMILVLGECAKLWPHLMNRTLPPLQEGETEERVDEAWNDCASEYLAARAEFRLAEANLKEAERKLKELASGASCVGGGVRFTVYSREGAIDYQRLLTDHPDRFADIDINQYRKQSIAACRITVEKEDEAGE